MRSCIDDTAFDAQPYGTGWAWDDEPYSYNAETSALTLSPDAKFSSGTVIVRVKPGAAAGAPAQVEHRAGERPRADPEHGDHRQRRHLRRA